MATRGISLNICYVAWDTANQVGKTGDAANHTLRWVKDGVSLIPTNSPEEVDSVNAPGIYKINITASEADCNIGVLVGKSSSSNVSIMPITIQFERLPDASPGANGGVPIIGAAPLTNLDVAVSTRADGSAYTNTRATKLDNLDAAITTRAPAATALSNTTWTDARAAKLDNLDVTISSRAPASTALSNTTWTDARATKLDNLDVSVSTRLAASAYVAPDNAGISAIKAKTDKMQFNASNEILAYAVNENNISASDIWSYSNRTLTAFSFNVDLNMGQTLPAAPTANTTGEALKFSSTRLDVGVSTRLAASAYVAPDNAGIASIKSKTDKLQFDIDNNVLAKSQIVVDKTGYSLIADYDRAKTALALSEYTAPDNASIAAIKAKTDKMQFNASNEILAFAVNESSGISAADVWNYTNRTLTSFTFDVNLNMNQTLPASPTADTTGESLKFSSTRLDAAVSTRLAASSYVAPDNTGISAIKTQTDKLQFDAANNVMAKSQVVVDKTGYELIPDYDRAKEALKYTEYVAPDNTGISAIKVQTDKMQFNANNEILAYSVNESSGGGSNAAEIWSYPTRTLTSPTLNVIVQPLPIIPQQNPTSTFPTILFWKYAKGVASWLVEGLFAGEDLRVIVFRSTDPENAIKEYKDPYVISSQQGTSFTLILLEAPDAQVPAPGTYRYVIRNQTRDVVLIEGELIVRPAPDAS